MQGFAGFLCAVIAAAGVQIIVIQVPDHRRPCVIQHPLDHACRCVLISCSMPRTSRARRYKSSPAQCEHSRSRSAGVPYVAFIASLNTFSVLNPPPPLCSAHDCTGCRPQLIFRNKFTQTANIGNCRARTCLRIEAISATMLILVHIPVRRSHIIIWPAHLDAALSAHCGRRCRGGRQRRIWPVRLRLHVQIHLLHIGRRWIIAAIQPHEQAGMMANANICDCSDAFATW